MFVCWEWQTMLLFHVHMFPCYVRLFVFIFIKYYTRYIFILIPHITFPYCMRIARHSNAVVKARYFRRLTRSWLFRSLWSRDAFCQFEKRGAKTSRPMETPCRVRLAPALQAGQRTIYTNRRWCGITLPPASPRPTAGCLFADRSTTEQNLRTLR